MSDITITIDRLERETVERALAAWSETTGAMLRREYGPATVKAQLARYEADLRRRLAPVFEALRLAEVPRG